MLLSLVLGIFLALFLVTLAANALFLWVGSKWLRVPGVTFKRCLGITLLVSAVTSALNAAVLWSPYGKEPLTALLLLGGSVLLSLVILRLLLHASLGKTILVALIWYGLAIGYSVLLVFVVSRTLFEAFIIPTGGMAETLWGYQKVVVCPQCGYEFPVNCSDEVEKKPPSYIGGGTCPNCRYQMTFAQGKTNPPCQGGDRIAVAKTAFYRNPERLDVVVFPFPEAPKVNNVPMNYVKRLVGLPQETVGIYCGKLHVLKAGKGPDYPDDAAAAERRKLEFMHPGELDALLRENDSPFKIIRKSPEQVLALRRIVFDNDHSPRDLKEVRRWTATDGTAWENDEPAGFHHAGKDEQMAWLRYQHILRQGPEPELITDFLGYNSKAYQVPVWGEGGQRHVEHPAMARNWVGDLILECEVVVDQPQGELALELCRGPDRFQARWDLTSGMCSLARVTSEKALDLDAKPTNLKKTGNFKLRFANVDDRLIVWVGGQLPFGDGVGYEAPRERIPTAKDLQPAAVGARNTSVHVHHLQLWRDNYYTVGVMPSADAPGIRDILASGETEAEKEKQFHRLLSQPERWEQAFQDMPCTTLYVQPNHYLVLGDNSPESADSRTWGLVPRETLIGKAVLKYYPFRRAGRVW